MQELSISAWDEIAWDVYQLVGDQVNVAKALDMNAICFMFGLFLDDYSNLEKQKLLKRLILIHRVVLESTRKT